MRSCSKYSAGNKLGSISTVAFSRIQVGSSLAHAVQNGSVRLHAVESMARRACGRRARIGRKAAMMSSLKRGFVGDNPGVDREPANGVIGARRRQHARAILQFERINIVAHKLGTDFEKDFSERRTASALWRCAGQAITDNDPGMNTIACAIAQAAVVVLPT